MSVEPARSNATVPTPTDPAVRVAELLKRTSAEAERADTKASILLAGTLAVVGGVSAMLSGARWNPLVQPGWLQTGWWAAVIAALWAVVALCLAVYPRGHRPDAARTVIGYFGDIVRYDSPAALAAALRDSPDEEATIDQVWQISVLVDAKYRLVRIAVRGLLLSLVLLLFVLVAALAR